MQLRYITIPENANIQIGDTPWSFANCVRHVVDSDPRFNENGVGIRAGVRILAQLQDKNTGDVITLDEGDWKMLHEAMEQPKNGLIPPLSLSKSDGTSEPLTVPGRMFLQYLDCLRPEATEEKP